MDKIPDHSLYFGRVMHARVSPFHHRFEYRVFSAFLDVDQLQELDSQTLFFSYNRFNVFSFHDVDHGPRMNAPLRPWIEHMLHTAGIDQSISSVKLLCYPRILGYVFNPLSVYYCYGNDENLVALIYEVSNTFGQNHCYVGRVDSCSEDGAFMIQSTEKAFYVSPFIEVSGQYQFRFDNPGEQLHLSIQQRKNDRPLLYTRFNGKRKPFSSRALLLTLVKYPLMTVKVITAIHWEALRLWFKGAGYVSRPAPPNASFTQAHSVNAKRRSEKSDALREAS